MGGLVRARCGYGLDVPATFYMYSIISSSKVDGLRLVEKKISGRVGTSCTTIPDLFEILSRGLVSVLCSLTSSFFVEEQ